MNHLAGTLNTQKNEFKKLIQKVNMIEVMTDTARLLPRKQ
jgi:hypothetical protein